MKRTSGITNLAPEEVKFLREMIEHHKMALVMAHDVLRTTDDHDVMSLSYSIIQTQTNEIALMQELIRQRA